MAPLVFLDGIREKDEKAKVAAKSLCSNKMAVEKYMDSLKEYFDCTICRDALDRPTQTHCGHVFCEKCLKNLSNQTNSTCPLCKKLLSNRSLIPREDVGDMANVVNKLTNTFTTDFQKYLKEKQKRSHMSDLAKMLKYAGKNETEKNELGQVQVECQKLKGSVKKPTKTKKDKGDEKPVKGKMRNTTTLTNDGRDTDNEVSVRETFKSNKTLNKNQAEVFARDTKENKTGTTKSNSVVNQGINQKYIIVSSDVIPQPLDLSVPSTRTQPKYTFKNAIKYVTPLDLSLKKEKRKFDETENMPDEGVGQYGVATSILETVKAGPLHKKGKFIDQQAKFNDSHSPRKAGSSNGQLERTTKLVDFENCSDTVSPINEPPVFTPTPPSSGIKRSSKNLTSDIIVNLTGMTSNTTPRRNIGVTQSNLDIGSEIMRDFDFPFEEEEEEEKRTSSGKEITCSDELLGNITDESFLSLKRRSQVRSSPSDGEIRINKDAFVFKQPTKFIPQVPMKKSKDNQSKKDDGGMVDFDDEFQQPRDSDLLFLNLSMSGNSPVSVKEKDNGTRKGRRQLSNASNKSQAAPSTKPSPTREYKRKTQIGDDGFEDDDDSDEDWLLNIPETSGQPKSGKQKKNQIDSTKTAETAKSSMPGTPEIPQQQRYVFCPTRLNKSHMLKLQEVCKMCNGTIVKDFTEEVTHLVINLSNGRVPQTLKYLLAIAGRKWVVIYDWIERCVESGELIPEKDFETSNFQHCDPGVNRSRLSKKNLFDGYKFYFASEIYKSLGFTKTDVLMLMEALGATVVTSAENRYRDLVIIGSFNGNSTEYNDWLLTNKWVTVTFDWVIECILEYRLKPFESKHLCVDTSKVKTINGPKAFQDALTQYLSQKLTSPRTII